MNTTIRHLLSLDRLSGDQINGLLDQADALAAKALGAPLSPPRLSEKTVVNLFFEPSTRTRSSFELAAHRLGASVLNFDMASSSTRKGETLADTLYTLEAMGCDIFVIRHSGDGRSAHPTQGLLDMLTIRQHKGRDFAALKVAIVGDIRHSRVARSDLHALRALGAGEVRLAAPEALLPEAEAMRGFTLCDNADQAVTDADVVMTLRLQRERMEDGVVSSLEAYFRDWGITPERLALAKPDAIVMHPGPMNRGVEIADAVADGPQSVIRQQVSNGVAVRMAVLSALRAEQV